MSMIFEVLVMILVVGKVYLGGLCGSCLVILGVLIRMSFLVLVGILVVGKVCLGKLYDIVLVGLVVMMVVMS